MKRILAISFLLLGPIMINDYQNMKENLISKKYEIAKNFYIREKSKEDFGVKAYKLERLSFYNLTKNQTDDTPDIASCGPIKKVKETIIAISQDLFFDKNRRKYLCGKKAKIISDLGIFEGVIYDTMNARYKRSADIVVDTYYEAIKLGISKNAILIVYEN